MVEVVVDDAARPDRKGRLYLLGRKAQACSHVGVVVAAPLKTATKLLLAGRFEHHDDRARHPLPDLGRTLHIYLEQDVLVASDIFGAGEWGSVEVVKKPGPLQEPVRFHGGLEMGLIHKYVSIFGLAITTLARGPGSR